MKDRIFRYLPLFFAISIGIVGIHGLVTSGNTSLMRYSMMFWLAWLVLMFMRLMYEFTLTLAKGDSLIQPSVLEPLILIPLTFTLLDVMGRNITELSIKPVWVCVMIAGLIVMGTAKLSEMILSIVFEPLMGLLFRATRKVANNRYTPNIPVVCRSCVYCTAHKNLLCAIRPLGPEHPRYCQSFKARKNEEVL